MEEIRMLSNLNAGKDNLLQIILAGQPALKLERKTMRHFAQRITMDFILEPLGDDETREYIVHRMGVAGRNSGDNLFTRQSYERIYRGSDGIPRLINILCDRALIYGFADELNTIDVCVIDEVMGDKKIKGQFYDTEQAREDALAGPSSATLSRKPNDVSRRLGTLERQFEEFQDKRNNGTIQRLEKLLNEERERYTRATQDCAQKDVTIKLLKQRIAQLTKRPGMKESGPKL
jgi:general secretion pathway protein A